MAAAPPPRFVLVALLSLSSVLRAAAGPNSASGTVAVLAYDQWEVRRGRIEFDSGQAHGAKPKAATSRRLMPVGARGHTGSLGAFQPGATLTGGPD